MLLRLLIRYPLFSILFCRNITMHFISDSINASYALSVLTAMESEMASAKVRQSIVFRFCF